jgi:hypothetical protein
MFIGGDDDKGKGGKGGKGGNSNGKDYKEGDMKDSTGKFDT